MAPIRLLGCVALLSACYPQASYDSTMPAEPTVVAGPPGGAMDPAWQPGYYGDPNDPGAAEGAGMGPGAAEGAVTGTVTDAEIDATLDGQGEWIEDDEYGYVWRPYTTTVGVDFTPYETCGSWVWTDAGWTFACEWDWGWLPFHYGRWGWFDDYWAWVPDYYWSPAWVEWRGGGGYTGWRPLAPTRDHRHFNPRDHRTGIHDNRIAKQSDSHWRFMANNDLGKPRIRAHLFKEPLEGLRVTSPAARPSVLGTMQPVRVGSIMQGRFAHAQVGFDRSPRPQTFQDPRTGRPYQPPYTSPSRGWDSRGWRNAPPPNGWNGARQPTWGPRGNPSWSPSPGRANPSWSGGSPSWGGRGNPPATTGWGGRGNPPPNAGWGGTPPPGVGWSGGHTSPPPSAGWSGGHASPPPSGGGWGGGHASPPPSSGGSWGGGHSGGSSGSFGGGGHSAPSGGGGGSFGGGGHSSGGGGGGGGHGGGGGGHHR